MLSSIKFVFLILISTLIFNVSASEKSDSSFQSSFNKEWKMLSSIHTTDMQKTFKKISELNIDIAGVDIAGGIIDILINDNDYINLERLGYNQEIIEIKGVTRGPDQEYKTPDEIEFLIREFADKFPEITSLVSIGRSLEGRDIWAIKISDNPELSDELEPAVLFNSMHHAREIMTPEVSLDIIETLLNGYNNDQKITNYINAYEIWVIPMFNVDGNNKMWTKDKWWRKNNRGGYGVDLNRNYPGNWNKCKGSSGWRSSQTYRGTKAGSEPETQAMMNFIKEVRPVFDISYHSYSELVIYPLGCSPEHATNKDVIEKIGKEIAQKLNYKAGTAWELLYNADGGDIDWMYLAYQVIPFVIELNSRTQGFHPSYAKWRDVTVKKNRLGWMHLLDRLSKSGVRGQFTRSNKAVSEYMIEVYRKGSNTLLQTYLGHQTGMYHIVLNPGSYKLKFKIGQAVVKEELINIGEKLTSLNITL